jgi:polyisoprenoid-binding protein YceI
MKTVYTVDPNHTTVSFAAKHMMVTTVHGKFHEWAGTVDADDSNPLTAVVTFAIKGTSVDSGLQMRDDDLRKHILDVEHHPEIKFRSTKVEEAGKRHYRVTGDLTIAGNSHPITLDVETEEEFRDVMGFQRVGFGARATLRRSDWDLNWNMVLEGGRLLAGEEVKIEIDGAIVRKADTPAGPTSA